MTKSPFDLPTIEPTTVRVAVEPIRSVLVAMSLLTSSSIGAGGETWLQRTAASLTDEQRLHNRIVFQGLGAALLPRPDDTDFLAYVDGLAVRDPAELAERVRPAGLDRLESPLQTAVKRLLDDPPAMQQLLVEHLRSLWTRSVAAEWERKLNTLRYLVQELDSRTWPTTSAGDAIRAFLRRELPRSIEAQLGGVRHVAFVPSPFLGLHATRLGDEATLWVFVQAEPWVLPMRSEPIRRGEALRTLQALADDTRLQILERLAAYEEMSAQEIIAELDVTQSTVSRHLKQLVRVDLIDEERGPGANKRYRLNGERVDQQCRTLKTLLSAENARQVLGDPRLEQPEELRRFLDRQLRVTDWPSRSNDQLLLLTYLAAKFEFGEEFTEQEVTKQLRRWHSFDNPVYLRRALVDFGLFGRTANGARYWRKESGESSA